MKTLEDVWDAMHPSSTCKEPDCGGTLTLQASGGQWTQTCVRCGKHYTIKTPDEVRQELGLDKPRVAATEAETDVFK
jgi:hypothetical protein